MKSIPVTDGETINTIKFLKNNKSAGYNNISSKVIKNCAIEISKPLTYIFNNLLKDRTYLEWFKYLLVKPIHKRGNNSYMTNYRPISLLVDFYKIVKTVTLNRLNQHLQVNKVLVPEQFGIRKSITIQQAIFTLTNSILSVLNKQQQAGEIFCDLSRAFDYTRFNILIFKFNHYRKNPLDGFNPILLRGERG
jgi:hypothetical protein